MTTPLIISTPTLIKQPPQAVPIPELLAKKTIKAYQLDTKLSIFATLVYHRQPEVTHTRQIKQIAQKLWVEFEQIKCNRKTLKNALENYQPFNKDDDDNYMRFSKFFNIDINIYEYNSETKIYEKSIIFYNEGSNDTLNLMVTDQVYYIKDVAKINIEPPPEKVIVRKAWVPKRVFVAAPRREGRRLSFG
jgi:hypothetical protein